MDQLIFDTTFLIDIQRERKRGQGKAHDFLAENRESFAFLPVVAVGEFREGFESDSDPVFLSVVEAFEILPVGRRAAEIYGREVRRLRHAGKLIGSNDLWIAATAMEKSAPLVTRNLDHFSRITGLELRGY